ncbi:MAG: cysteine desulfurase [Puniceicoccales bacterium]|jgi:cysteine desulfurase/selenocysteine lyase|nr:cysteine desulfurase [Puniceicoccales bacterium]
MFDVGEFRSHFPILGSSSSAAKLVYVDNAATTQKPTCVISSICDFYQSYNSNINHGLYDFAIRATEAYESTRSRIAKYLNVSDREIVFTYGTTDGMNILAASYGRKFLAANDEVLLGAAEHHSSCLPWRQVSAEMGARVKIIPLRGEQWELDVDFYRSMFSKHTKLVVIQHISNVLGNENNIKLLSEIAHENGAKIIIDGAASMVHGPMDLRAIDCDFFVTSGHKSFGPSGSGFMFGKYELLRDMPPFRMGGRMVNEVSFDGIVCKSPPERFEGGTPSIASTIGFGESIKFLSEIDWVAAKQYLAKLSKHCRDKLLEVEDIKLYGSGEAAIFSFNVASIHCHDVATILAQHGIAVRAGHHCAQPLMGLLGAVGTARLSLCLYNTFEEIDFTAAILKTCKNYFA